MRVSPHAIRGRQLMHGVAVTTRTRAHLCLAVRLGGEKQKAPMRAPTVTGRDTQLGY